MLRALFMQPGVLATTLAAAGILAITMGARQSMGLFVSPMNTSTGLGIGSNRGQTTFSRQLSLTMV